ncbi:CobW family GTP-binding protein [Kineothrix sedimenti]|uniref:GTP-binding protein n=1 Tax=Kineothrix sedimenti TaxID=3123317 RepID=A0ABZ3F1P5_9FIRM
MSGFGKKIKKPVTLITGYLGSGKTTVMNELLRNEVSKKVALIVNDMGSINLDADLLKKGSISRMDTTMIELQNGCICCTLRDEFMEQIEQLSKEDDIEAILVEASGISDPAAIADGFLAYEEMHKKSSVFLNTIVTVVDADRIYTEFLAEIEELQNQMDEEYDPDIINLVIDQIEFCNVIILNKCDLLNKKQLEKVKMVIRQLQPEAEMIETVHGKVDAKLILNKKRFDYAKVNNSSAIQKALAREARAEEDGRKEYGIESFVFEERRPFEYNAFINYIEQEYPASIIRAKGYVWFADDDIHVQLFEQAGRNASVTEVSNWIAAFSAEEQKEVFEEYPETLDDWDEAYGDRMNQIVFIGREYDEAEIRRQLNRCIAG